MSSNNKHIFAVYYPAIDQIHHQEHCVIQDADTVKRVTKVLRIKPGEVMHIFGRHIVAECKLEKVEKKQITVYVADTQTIAPLFPALYWYVPIAEKSAFEDAISYLTVIGAHTIYPIITEKSKRTWGDQKDFDRIHRVMVAAAEQSKQFALPHITAPYYLTEIPYVADYTFVCDPDGSPIRNYMTTCTQSHEHTTFAGIVGPEAGLTDEELAYLDRLGCIRLRLVPSILRMETAVIVASGMIRSIVTE